MTRVLSPRRLTRDSFAPFGDVIGTEGAEMRLINNGTTRRYHDLARVEVLGEKARVLLNIFRGEAFELPIRIAMMERHPLGSQAFMPLQELPWLAVVAPDEGGKPGHPVAFLVEPGAGEPRGVNYAPGTWHHPLLSLGGRSDFLVVDRGGTGENLQEHFYPEPYLIESLA